MSLELFLHPLSSYCHKVLIAFYENDIPFEVKRVDDPSVAREWELLWPLKHFPILRDAKRGRVIPESTIIIEYLQTHFPGRTKLIPDDPDLAGQVRLRDRLFDNHLHTHMQKFAGDHLRPQGKKDAYGVDDARARYVKALDLVDAEMARRTWATGDTFTMADCAAAPALFYGNRFFGPFRETHPNAIAYLDRLMARPSYARALEEAKPFMHLLPK
ncbi:MAG TPA: glutathione S-transferase family protein [Steroidobacteraceae bacterium]|nr:glutathione S-transferase family protein [Steroidobacteraceae bacterium]